MPGAGKSSIGIKLAKSTGKNFLDTDSLIEITQGRTLQEIIDSLGYMELRRIEENILLKVNHTDHVISTGGSAPYSHKAMIHLKKNGIVIFLNVTIEVLKKRIHNFDTRGIAKRADQSFEELFEERRTLYVKYADIIVENSFMSLDQTCKEIVKRLG
jgi:shikimate kinase